MKKTNARALIRNWGTITANLKPGETLEVTARGKPHLKITKPGTTSRRQVDFSASAKADGIRGKEAAAILKLFRDDEAVP